jgi:hypothetical protein
VFFVFALFNALNADFSRGCDKHSKLIHLRDFLSKSNVLSW